MTPFEQMWEASRTNAFSGQTEPVNHTAMVAVVVCCLLPKLSLIWRLLACFAVIVAASMVTTNRASQEIEEKWRIRYDYVQAHQEELSDDERFAVTVDGANRLMGPLIFGALETVKRCGMVLIIMLCGQYFIRRILQQERVKNQTFVTSQRSG